MFRKMDRDWSDKFYSKRISYGFPYKINSTSGSKPVIFSKFQQDRGKMDRRENRRLFIKREFGNCRRKSETDIKFFPSSKTGNKVIQISSGSETFKYNFKDDQEDKIGNIGKFPTISEEGRSSMYSGSEGFLSPFFNSNERQGFSSNRMERQNFDVHNSDFRLERESIFSNKDYENCNKLPQVTGFSPFKLPRRPNLCSSEHKGDRLFTKRSDENKQFSEYYPQLRFRNSRFEESTPAPSFSVIPRFNNRYFKDDGISSKEEIKGSVQNDGYFFKGKISFKEVPCKDSRKIEFNKSRFYPSSLVCKTIPRLCGEINGQKSNEFPFLERKSIGDRRSEESSGIFLKECKTLEWKNLSNRRSFCDFGNRLVKKSVWSSSKFRGNNSGFLVGTRDGETYKLEGIKSSFDCDSKVDKYFEGQKNCDKDRQQSSLLLPEESRRKNRRIEFSDKRDSLDLFPQQYSNSTSNLGSNGGELSSRFTIKGNGCNRLGIITGGVFNDRKEVLLQNGSGSFCFGPEYETSKVQCFKQDNGKVCGSNRLFFPKLEGSNELGKPSFQSDSKSIEIYKKSTGGYNYVNSELEKSNLVQRSDGIKEGDDRTRIVTAELLFKEDRCNSRTSKESKMEIFGIKDKLLKESWLTIRQSWAESTKKLYYKVWEKFVLFAEMEDLEIYPAEDSTILKFMMSLSKTAPSSVKTFVTVYSILCSFNNWINPRLNEAIKRLEKAIEKRRKKRKKVEPFPLKILKHHWENIIKRDYLNWLRDGLIVALCVRTTWRAETVAEIRVKNVQFKDINNERFVIIDIFKSKTNQTGEMFRYFIDPSKEKEYCIVDLLQKYLVKKFGENWQDKNDLLFTENGNKLNSTIITEIIKKMADRAEEKIKLSSRSLRSGAVVWMLEAGLSIENLKALGWKETSTAYNCYIRNSAIAMQGGSNKMYNLK